MEEHREAQYFELAPAGIDVRLKTREGAFTHVLRPPKLEDWLAYDAALEPSFEKTARDGGVFERFTQRLAEAAAELWGRIVERVEGYGEDGREAVPDAHKEAAIAAAFAAVMPAELASPGRFARSETRVALAVSRGSEYHPQLVHRFRRPAAADRSRWRRMNAGLLHVQEPDGQGGILTRSVTPPHLADQVQFYDEFILGVEGYAVGGKPELSLDEIKKWMDAQHKRVAISECFAE